MNVRLTVQERLVIFNSDLLPQEGRFDTLRAVRQAREALALSEAEKEIVKWTVSGNRAEWLSPEVLKDNPKIIVSPTQAVVIRELTVEGIVVDLPNSIYAIITSKLVALEQAEKLPMDYFGLYEKFCEPQTESLSDPTAPPLPTIAYLRPVLDAPPVPCAHCGAAIAGRKYKSGGEAFCSMKCIEEAAGG